MKKAAYPGYCQKPPSAHEGKEYVWVISGEPKVAKRREVTNLTMTGRGVRVLGVQTGEWVATAGVHYLREGQKVRILGQQDEE